MQSQYDLDVHHTSQFHEFLGSVTLNSLNPRTIPRSEASSWESLCVLFELKNKRGLSYFGYFVLLVSHKYVYVMVFMKLILLEEGETWIF